MSFTGLNMTTGRNISGLDHLRQSVRDILITPIGSRVMRRDYGSGLFELIDQNLTGLVLAQIYAATADALRKWEPRLRVTRVQAEALPEELEEGRITITLEGQYLPEGREITLEGIVL
jgi:phage baseplate assembly protein W